jgi:hypothetical protein
MNYMIKKINVLLAVALAAILTSCAVTDVDRSANLGALRSFSWGKSDVKVENPVYKGDLIDKNIKSTIEQEFAKRGIVKKNSNPDFLVSYHTYTEKKEQTSGSYYGHPFYGPYGFSPFMYRWAWRFPYSHRMPQTYTYTEGTLIIDIVDTKTDEVVWRGSVAGRVDAAKLQKQIDKGVKAIMKKYPVTPESSPLLPSKPDNA